jgi:hypothetical protein
MSAEGGPAETSAMAHSTARCPSCHSSDVVSVYLAVTDDMPFAFGFWTQCEWRGWDSEGHGVPLTFGLRQVARR